MTWPNNVRPTLIHVRRKEAPSLELPPQHQVDHEKDSMGPNTQYEKAGVKMRAGKLTMVFSVFQNPIDDHIVMKAWKINK